MDGRLIQNKMISVIIPVFGVEAYLPDCIDSIVNQTYSNLEIILIDDESPDQCGRICDEYAEKDSRIRVIHQKNGGAASARNAGLRIATGEYLAFVDSDDYLEPDAYAFMLGKMTEAGADVIQCSFRDVYRGKIEDRIMLAQPKVFTAEEYLRRYTEDWTCGLLWDKLYKRRLFDDVFFEEGHKIDDEFFTYQGIMRAGLILHRPEVVYNYRQRASAVTQRKDVKQQIILDKLDYLEKRRKKILAQYPSLRQDFDYHYLNMLLILSKDSAATEKSIFITKRLLGEYFHGDSICKMEFSLRVKLFQLMHCKAERWLQMRSDEAIEENKDFFE